MFRANFIEDQDISDAHVIAAALERAGVQSEPVLALAVTPEVKQQLRANTDEARALGMFGAPDFVVGGELFFGQDRLGDAIAWSTRRK